MKYFWLGPVLMFAGLYGLILAANPWGVPAFQPWFTLSGIVGGAGVWKLCADLEEALR